MRNNLLWCALAATTMFTNTSALLAAENASTDEKDSLETIVVSATRTERSAMDIPAHVTALEMDTLITRGFRVGGDEFRAEAGINFRRGEGDNDEFTLVNFRGITGNHGNDTFLALLDGIPFVSADEEILLNEIPYAAVGRVEFVRGPVSTLYGRGGISGAVNYQTLAVPDETKATLRGTLGSDEFYALSGTYSTALSDNARVLISGNYENSEGWRENNEREIVSLFAKAEFDLSEQTKLTSWVQYLDRTSENGSVIPLTPSGELVNVAGGRTAYLGYDSSRSEIESFFGAVRLNHSFSDRYEIELTAYARDKQSHVQANFYDPWGFDASRNVFGVNGFRSPNDAQQYFIEGVFSASLANHDIKFGASYERSVIDEQDFWSGQNGFTFECGFTFYSIEIDYSTGEVLNADHPCFARDEKLADDNGVNQFFGLFLQDEITVTDRLNVTLGLRYDRFERDVDFASIPPFDDFEQVTDEADAISPKVSVNYRLENHMLYAAYGRGFTANFGPLWKWDPFQYIRDTRPSKLDSFEVGVKGRTEAAYLSYQLALYYIKQKDRAVTIPNPAAETDFTAPFNIATSGQEYSSRGLEASLEYRPDDRTQLAFRYAYTDAEWDKFELTGADVFTGNKPRGIAPHTIWASAGRQLTDWLRAEVTYEWYDDYAVTLDNTVENGSYSLLGANLSVSGDGLGGFRATLSATNLLNKEYYFYYGGQTAATLAVPGVPRQIRLSISKDF